MNQKEMLQKIEADLQDMLDKGDCKVIDLVKFNYDKVGIGNDEMKKKVIELLLSECRKQLSEL